MARMTSIIGAQAVIRKLKAYNTNLARKYQTNSFRAGLFIQRKSMEIVPVDKGNLRGSAYTRNMGGSGFRTDIFVGYTADYAMFVHEDLEAAHGERFNIKYAREIAAGRQKRRGKDQQAKFLEKPIRDNRQLILRMIANGMKII